MKRPDRYFMATLAAHAAGDVVSLEEREAGHAARVKRQVPGNVIELFDGAGRHARAVVASADRRRGVTAQIESVADEPPPTVRIHLACAVPRGDRMETLLDMATQLGVTRVTPLVFAHSTAAGAGRRLDRWHRVVVEACKQSRRSHLPVLEELTGFDAWLERAGDAAPVRWLADPHGREPSAGAGPADGVVVVGPEGGLTDGERAAALAADFKPVRIGANILRVETAAVAAVVALGLAFRPARRE